MHVLHVDNFPLVHFNMLLVSNSTHDHPLVNHTFHDIVRLILND